MTSFLDEDNNEKLNEQGSNIRVTSPALAIIDRSQYKVKNWSAGGCKISNFHQRVKIGDCLPIQFCINGQDGCEIKIKILIKVVWVSEKNKQLGVEFLHLTKFEKELLNSYIKQLPEANLANQNFKRNNHELDSSDLPKLNRPSSIVSRKRNFKVILSTFACLVSGCIFGYFTLAGLRESITLMEIKSAVISQPIEPIAVTNWGTISQIYVQEGMAVEADQPLFRVSNDLKIHEEIVRLETLIRHQAKEVENLTEKLTFSRLELAEAQLELQKAEALERLEKTTIAPQANIAQSRLKSAQAKLQALTTQYQVTKDNHQRFVTLFKEGVISQKIVDEERVKLADLEGNIKASQEELQIAKTVLLEVKKGKFLDHNRLVTKLQSLNIDKQNAREKLRLNAQETTTFEHFLLRKKRELQTLEEQKHALEGKNLNNYANNNLSTVYKAPVSGLILKVLKSSGNTVKRNETLVLLQHELEQPIIDAYMTQAQAAQVEIGSQATILIPTLGKSYQAKVIKLDRTGGVTDEIMGQYQLRGSQEQPAYVKLRIMEITPEDETLLTVGTPVIIKIPKKFNIIERFFSRDSDQGNKRWLFFSYL